MIVELELMSKQFPTISKMLGKTAAEQIDIKLMSNPRYLHRYKTETSLRVPFNFKLILIDINLNEISNITQTYATLKKLNLIYPPTKDIITIIFGPSGDPMKLSTSSKGVWMFGHKLGHAMFSNYITSMYYKKLKENCIILEQIQNVLLELYNVYHNTCIKVYKPNLLGWNSLCKHLSPFKSARTETLVDNSEYICELVAQYVMFGKVYFNENSIAFSYIKNGISVSSYLTSLIYKAISNTKGLVLVDR